MKLFSRRTLLVAGLLAASADVAQALTLRKPVVPVNGGQLVSCTITNFNTKAVEFSVQLLAANGSTVMPDISTCQTTISPMSTCSVLPPVDTDVGASSRPKAAR